MYCASLIQHQAGPPHAQVTRVDARGGHDSCAEGKFFQILQKLLSARLTTRQRRAEARGWECGLSTLSQPLTQSSHLINDLAP